MDSQQLNAMFWSFIHRLQDQPKSLMLGETFILLGLIAWAEGRSPWDYGLFAFYTIPVALLAYTTELRVAIAASLFCAMAWWAGNSDSAASQMPRTVLALAIFGHWLYCLLIVFAMTAFRKIRNLNQKISEQKTQFEKDLFVRQELEQEHLARELHDNLGSQLVSIRFALAFLAKELSEQELFSQAAKIERIILYTEEATGILRGILNSALAKEAKSIGLSRLIRELVYKTSLQSHVKVNFYEIGDSSVPDPQQCVHVYRIVQEAMANVLKHSQAKMVTIILNKTPTKLHLAIVDNGKGLQPSQDYNDSSHFGMCSMKYRAQSLGGELKVENNPSGGVIVSLEIPLSCRHQESAPSPINPVW